MNRKEMIDFELVLLKINELAALEAILVEACHLLLLMSWDQILKKILHYLVLAQMKEASLRCSSCSYHSEKMDKKSCLVRLCAYEQRSAWRWRASSCSIDL
jgi:hypothetical protein